MNRFQNKYRIASARLQNWDYSWAGAYFITICTQNREHYFGEIKNKKMILSPIGVIADILWYEIPHYAKNVESEAFVVMPNHIHGILIINSYMDNDNTHIVETGHALSLSQTPNETSIQPITIGQQRFQNIGKNSISSIIGSYKSAVTKHAQRLGFDFQWQTRFHDHIIRDDQSFQKISNYIENNAVNWREDKFFKFE